MCTHGRSTGARIVYTVTINTAGEDGSCSRVVLTGGHEHDPADTRMDGVVVYRRVRVVAVGRGRGHGRHSASGVPARRRRHPPPTRLRPDRQQLVPVGVR